MNVAALVNEFQRGQNSWNSRSPRADLLLKDYPYELLLCFPAIIEAVNTRSRNGLVSYSVP